MKTLKQFKTEADTTYEILDELGIRHDSYKIFSDKEVKAIWKHLKEKSYINLNDIPTFYSVLKSDNYRSYNEYHLNLFSEELETGQAELLLKSKPECLNDETYCLIYFK